MSAPAGNIAHVEDAVRRAGGRLMVDEGKLKVAGWAKLRPELQREIQGRCYELVVTLTRHPDYALGAPGIARLRRWAELGVLDAIGDELVAQLGSSIPAGQAGSVAAYWLRCYDAGGGEHAERPLRGIYYCALVYWTQRVQRPIP